MEDGGQAELMRVAGELPGATCSRPFGPDADVFKVGGRLFALFSTAGSPGRVTLKAPPELCAELRDDFAAVTPGYHMNKRHWVTIVLDGTVPHDLVRDLVVDAHALVAPRRAP